MLRLRRLAGAGALLALAWLAYAPASAAPGIAKPLQGLTGDAERGRALVADRQQSLCLLCHSLGEDAAREAAGQGNLAPPLAGAGARANSASLRQRLVDSRRINAASIMPAYFSVAGRRQVGAGFEGRTLLSAQQIEDVLAYLLTLR